MLSLSYNEGLLAKVFGTQKISAKERKAKVHGLAKQMPKTKQPWRDLDDSS